MKPVYRTTARTALLLLLATSGAHSIADSNHYRWLDDRGNPVYSDRAPPKGVDYEVVSAGSSLKRVVAAEEGAVPAEIEPRVGNEFEQTESRVKLKHNPEQCQRARTNLEALTTSDQVKVRNEQGEVRLLSPEEMEVQRQTAEAQISVYCE